MKKNLFILLTLCLLFLCACEKGNDSIGIVGTWTCDNHYDAGTDTYVFSANGTYIWSCPGQADSSYESGKYSYDLMPPHMLTMVNTKGIVKVCVIQTLTSTFFMMRDDGKSYYYQKQKHDNDNSSDSMENGHN